MDIERKDGGFTAIELLAVLAIAAILAALTVPQFGRLSRNASLVASANQLLAALHYARSFAILRHVPTVLCLSANDATCLTAAGTAATGWVVFVARKPGSPPQVGAADQILRHFVLPQGVSVSGARSAVTYWPTPRAGTTDTFKICVLHSGLPGRSVVVSQTGRPRVAGVVPCGG